VPIGLDITDFDTLRRICGATCNDVPIQGASTVEWSLEDTCTDPNSPTPFVGYFVDADADRVEIAEGNNVLFLPIMPDHTAVGQVYECFFLATIRDPHAAGQDQDSTVRFCCRTSRTSETKIEVEITHVETRVELEPLDVCEAPGGVCEVVGEGTHHETFPAIVESQGPDMMIVGEVRPPRSCIDPRPYLRESADAASHRP